MERGWIWLYRKLLDSRVFQNEGLLKVWIWCLLKANHKGQWTEIKSGRGTTEVWVPSGSFIFGRFSAAEALRMKPSTVWKRILKLKSMENLNIESNSLYSMIYIVNWTIYQSPSEKSDSKSDNQVTGKEHKQECKEIYKGNYFSVTASQHQKYADAYPGLDLINEYKKMEAWLESNPSKRKKRRGYPPFINRWLANAHKQIKNSPENWRDKLPEL